MQKYLLCLLLFFVVPMAVLADNLSDARKAYDAKDYAKSAQLFAAAVKEKNDAKSNYGLGLSYLRLGRNADAVKPLETAQRLDPSLAFAKNRSFFEQRLAEARSSGAGTNQKSNAPTMVRDPHLDQVLADLTTGKAVMDYTGTLTPADLNELQKVVSDASSRGFNLRAYLIQPNRSLKTKDFATHEVKKYANLKANEIVVICSQEGIYATGKAGETELDTKEINQAATETLPLFKQQSAGRTGFGLGMAGFSRALLAEATSDRSTRRGTFGFLSLLGLGAAGAGVAFVIGRRKLKQKAYKNKLDEGINLLMNEINDKLGKEFDVNARFVNWQTEYEAIKAESNWKDHTKIDRFNATLQDAVRQPERYFSYKPGIAEIKAEAAKLGAPVAPQRNNDEVFDYFDGRPLNKDEAVVVALKDKDGQEIRVLTSRVHADEMGQGQVPKVLTREVNGQRVHWSNDPTFDPHRDYRPYYGGSSWVDIWMMSQIFSPHTYYGPAIYPYYHQDYYYSQPYYSQPIYDSPGYGSWDNSNSIGFGEERRHYREEQYQEREQHHHQNDQPQDYDNSSGGADFGGSNDSSTNSSWSSDSSSSSSDWSDSSSSGSSDWGGGDSGGGSDFGGGGGSDS